MQTHRKLIVIGGGAAGFFCAINAARLHPYLEVTIIEKSGKVLSKVKVSGGGRCNVTHESSEIDDMLDAYPRGRHFMRKTLHQFSTADTIQWFSERGVELKVESDGRMFPVSNNSQTIVDCLLKEADRRNIRIVYHKELSTFQKKENGFELNFKHSEEKIAGVDFICIATGGFPKFESFRFLTDMGLDVEAPVPSLFTFNIADKHLHALMGVSSSQALVKIPVCKMEQRGPVLITHWGLSGPAVLKLSSYAARELQKLDYAFDAVVNWCPDFNESSMLEKLKSEKSTQRGNIGNKNIFSLTTRLWEYLLFKSDIDPASNWQDIQQKKLVLLSKNICSDQYPVRGKTTFKEEFVTAGGVKLTEIDPLSMESKKIPGLFFVGEILDVDGITGGYNFQHAWSSGMVAARAIGSKLQL
jgi:predicted Rossmann fold flavoprotein